MEEKSCSHISGGSDWQVLVEPACSHVIFEEQKLVDPIEYGVEDSTE